MLTEWLIDKRAKKQQELKERYIQEGRELERKEARERKHRRGNMTLVKETTHKKAEWRTSGRRGPGAWLAGSSRYRTRTGALERRRGGVQRRVRESDRWGSRVRVMLCRGVHGPGGWYSQVGWERGSPGCAAWFPRGTPDSARRRRRELRGLL